MLNLPGQKIIGKRAGERLIARQDILKFEDFNLRIVNEAGAPTAKYEAGSLFYNGADNKLYLSADFKITHTPNLAWYKCNAINENKLQDFSGKRNDATTTSVTTTTGKYKDCLSFDGINDKIEIPSSMDMEFHNNWTFNCWVYVPPAMAIGEKIYLIERYLNPVEYFGFYLKCVDNIGDTPEVWMRFKHGGSSFNGRLWNGTISKGTWVYMNFTYYDDGNDLWVNGHLAEFSSDVEIAFTTEPFVIGYSTVDTSFGTDFLMDEIKFFDTFRKLVTLDRYDLDVIHWVSYPGTTIE